MLNAKYLLPRLKRFIWPILIGLTLALCVYAFKPVRLFVPEKPAQQTTVPEVLSCVSGIKILRVEVTTPEAPQLEVEVENESLQGIVAISLEWKNADSSYGTVLRTNFYSDGPKVVINPHKSATLRMQLRSEFMSYPAKIGAAIFEDGTEQGCDWSLGNMHELKQHDELEKEPHHEENPLTPPGRAR